MEDRKTKKEHPARKIITIFIIVVVAFLMLDLNNRLAELFNLREQHGILEMQVTEMVATKYYLITKQAYATSELAVQEWAREDGHMIQEGDHPIVPVAPQDGQVTLEPFVFSTPTPVRNVDIWYELFFGR
jgi:hypothetical protein